MKLLKDQRQLNANVDITKKDFPTVLKEPIQVTYLSKFILFQIPKAGQDFTHGKQRDLITNATQKVEEIAIKTMKLF